MHKRFVIMAAAIAVFAPTPAVAQSEPPILFGCKEGDTVNYYVVRAGEFRRGRLPGQIGENECTPATSCEWKDGVLKWLVTYKMENGSFRGVGHQFDLVRGIHVVTFGSGSPTAYFCTKIDYTKDN